jgi:hypothetical protein
MSDDPQLKNKFSKTLRSTNDTSHADLASTPVHRPGMEGVVNRGADARDSDGNRTSSERPQASPGTQSAFGAASASAPAPKAAPAAAPVSAPPEVNAVEGHEREAQITDYVDKAAQ